MSLATCTKTLAALLLGYGLLELTAYLAFEPLTGVAFGDVEPAAGDAPEAPDEPDVREGRERAGLGFRDEALSIHPYLGYVYTPAPPGAEPGPVAVSPDGFLDEASAVRRRDPGKLLVGLVGGSVAGQLGTWYGDRLRAALEEHVGDGREVELVRLGMPGYHQPQQVIQLAWLLAQGGELDVLLNVDGFNEVAVPAALNAPQGAHPLFPMNWSMVALDVPDLALRSDLGAVVHLEGERERRRAEFEDSWRSWTVWGRVLEARADRRLASRIAEHRWSLARFMPEEVPWFVRGPERHHALGDELVPFCVDVWKRCSLQLQALCDAHGIRYLHVLQPNQYVPGSKPLGEAEREAAVDESGPYKPVVEAGYPLLVEAGKELEAAGVHFLDLTELFADLTDPVYVDNCCHYNALGNELLADAVALALAG